MLDVRHAAGDSLCFQALGDFAPLACLSFDEDDGVSIGAVRLLDDVDDIHYAAPGASNVTAIQERMHIEVRVVDVPENDTFLGHSLQQEFSTNRLRSRE